MGGQISVESQKDIGSTFTFTILLDDWKEISEWDIAEDHDDSYLDDLSDSLTNYS